ncbi:MAG: hypothetical protein JNM56_37680 [Planctomycetia bacterium]|nr:hypothetical protein [Planctomycetia bacterium]
MRIAVSHLLQFDDPCILFPLHREAAPFLREFRPQERAPGAPVRARFCGPAWLTVLVLETGIGAARTETALTWVLGQPEFGKVPYRPKLVLSAGFAGGLQEQLQVGDVLLADEVVDLVGNRWPTTWPGELPTTEWRPPIQRGRFLSVPQLVGDPSEKRRLGEKYQAAALDMESAHVARMCSKQGIPFGCVRVVSDALATPLSPRLVSLLAGGRVSWLALAGLLLRAPGSLGELWRLAKDTRFAAGQLGTALGELLTLTLPGGKEL